MTVSKADFNAIADAFHEEKPEVWFGPRGGSSAHDRIRLGQWENDVQTLARVLKSLNSRFKTEHFIDVCTNGRESKPSNVLTPWEDQS